jgi:hypothetical protein
VTHIPEKTGVTKTSPSRKVRAAARRTLRGVGWTASVLSLLLCLAAAALWVRGRTTVDTVVWRTGHPVGADWQRTEYMSRSLHGRVVFWNTGRLMTRRELGPDPAAAHAKLDAETPLRHWANEARVFRRDWPGLASGYAGALGFRWQDAVVGTSAKLGIPLPVIVAVTAVIPLIHLSIWLRAKWRTWRIAQRTPPPTPPTQRPGPPKPGPGGGGHSSVPARASRGI